MARKDTRLFARLDLDYADHPKIAILSDAAFRAHVEMILYARKYMTDGVIPNRVANRLGFESLSELQSNDPDTPSLVKLSTGDYYLHGYEDMNETRDDVDARRRRNSRNGARGGRPKNPEKTQSVTESVPQSQTHWGTQKKAETETETDIERTTFSHAQTSGSSERATRFDEFWSAYPRKVGKDKARAKYMAAVKRAGDEQTVIDGAHRLSADPNLPEKQFIPYPTTWLERGGWDDEPLPQRLDNLSGSQKRLQQAREAFGGVPEGYQPPIDPFAAQIATQARQEIAR